MAKQTRRNFIKYSAVAGGAAALAPVGVTAAQKPLEMAIVRHRAGEGAPVDDNDAVDKLAKTMTEQAIAALGGMERFVKKGDVVWIKPNIGWDRKPEQGANTNPVVVATLVHLCLAAGAKTVKVGDNACNPARKSYPRSGIAEAAEAAGAEVVYLRERRFKEYELGGKVLRKSPLYPDIVESDLVINVPIVKSHSIAKGTMCMKNYMGLVDNSRSKWHQNLPACLCDITAFMKPPLCVLDGTRVMFRSGPTGGSLADVKRMDTIAAGTDIVALDALGAELLGHKPEDIESVVAGHKAGLGEMDYRKLALKEIDDA